MKKKIIFIVFSISLLLMVSCSNTIGKISYNSSESIKFKEPDLPVWSVGDFWEYNLTLIFASVFSIEIVRMEAIVSNISYDTYTLKLDGYINKVIISDYDYTIFIDALYLDGFVYIDKSTLSIKEYNLTISGNLQNPKIDFFVTLKMIFDKNIDFLDFPIKCDGEDTWNIENKFDFYISGYGEMNGKELFIIDEKSLNNPINDELSVLKKEDISVEAGTFESFLISGKLGNPSEIWYSHEAGYLVKAKQNIPKFLKYIIKIRFESYLELLSTNFNHPDNNTTPIPQIIGPMNGKPKTEYEYKVSTIDSNGENVYYKIDWGDGQCTNWIGPYDSAKEIIVTHSWNMYALYKIRVKAMDENGYQTSWFPLNVTMLKYNKINNLFLNLLENYPNTFTIFRHLL